MIVDLPKLTSLSMDGEALSGLEKFFYANITDSFYNQFCTQYNVACSPIVWIVCYQTFNIDSVLMSMLYGNHFYIRNLILEEITKGLWNAFCVNGTTIINHL